MSLEDQLEPRYAEAWRPKDGETLVGELTSIGERDAGRGCYPVLTIRQDDGEELAAHCFHTVLAGELAKLAPEVGERLAIRYLGEVQKRDGGGRYHSYRVAVDRDPAQSIDWARYRADDSPAEPAGPLAAPPPDDYDDIPF